MKQKWYENWIHPTILPSAIYMFLFLLLPMCLIITYSFFKTGDYGKVHHVFNIGNYVRITDYIYLHIIFRSFLWALFTLLATLLLAYPVAYWLAFYVPSKRRNLYFFILLLPSWATYILRIYSWMFILRNSGLLNEILITFHLIEEPIKILYTPLAVVFGLIYTWFYLMLIPLYSSLERLDQSVLEAAADLGANNFWIFIKVTLPLTKGGILAGSLLVGIPAIGAYVVPQFLGGGKHSMVGSSIATLFLEFSNWPLASAFAVLLLLLMVTASYVYIRIGGKNALERLMS